MRAKTIGILLSLCLVPSLLAYVPARGSKYNTSGQKVRFAPVHIYLDSGDKPLAAYQFELKAKLGQIKIVGVEGGEHPAFREAPYYDPAALMNDRIIIAAFNTGTDLPHGRTRIATIHLQILGDAEPQYELKLTVAADADSVSFPGKIALEEGENGCQRQGLRIYRHGRGGAAVPEPVQREDRGGVRVPAAAECGGQ